MVLGQTSDDGGTDVTFQIWPDLRSLLIDLFGLVAVMTILAVLYYFLPRALQNILALNHQNPQVWDFFTSSFMHQHLPGDIHLINNLMGFATTAGFSLFIYSSLGLRRRFWKAALLMIVPGAVVINIISYVVYSSLPQFSLQYSRGFSGVVGAFGGFLIASLLAYWSALIFATLHNRTKPGVKPWLKNHANLILLSIIGAAAAILIFAGLVLTGVSGPGGALTNIVAHGVGLIIGLIAGQYFFDISQVPPQDLDLPTSFSELISE